MSKKEIVVGGISMVIQEEMLSNRLLAPSFSAKILIDISIRGRVGEEHRHSYKEESKFLLFLL